MAEFSMLHWVIVGLIGFWLYKLFAGKSGGVMYCKNCGHTGKTESKTPGNMTVEIILWICFILPGLAYSIWRVSNKSAVCEKCQSKELVPPDSPVAVAAQKHLNT